MDKRKEEIIDIAIRRFSHYGFSKTTMNEIADDLGITKANLYYYYPDKAALILDVIQSISKILISSEGKLVDSYSGDFLGTLFALLNLRAEHMRKYYMFYINENLDWAKGVEITRFIQEIEHKDFNLFMDLVSKAIDDGTLILPQVEESCMTFKEIIRGLTLTHTVEDVISGIPNRDNIDKILESQINAVKLIFGERIVTNI